MEAKGWIGTSVLEKDSGILRPTFQQKNSKKSIGLNTSYEMTLLRKIDAYTGGKCLSVFSPMTDWRVLTLDMKLVPASKENCQ